MPLKVSPSCKVKAWCQRFNIFQDYLPRCIWIVGAKQGKWPIVFEEVKKQEILEFALPV